MHTRSSLVALLLGLVALLAASLTTASGRTTQRATATAKYRVQEFSHTKTYPAVGSKAVYTGLVTSRWGRRGRVRHGAVIARNRITSIQGNVYTSRSTITSYYPDGINRHRGTTKATLHPDGSISLKGKGKVTGGTARWRGLRGSYTTTGSQRCLGCQLVFTGKAKLILP